MTDKYKVKTKKQDMRLRELFRQKLANTEIIPSASVNSKLMRKLAIREFLRFNPVRLNIYYLGGIIITGITAAVILSSGKDNANQLPALNISGKTIESVSLGNENVPGKQTQIQKSDKSEKSTAESIKSNIIRPKTKTVLTPSRNITPVDNNIISHTGVNDSFSKKDIIVAGSHEKNKLQGGFRIDKPLFETSVKAGCMPLNVRFINLATSFDSCRWTFGDGGYSNETNPEWIFDVEGEYKVILNVFGPDGLQSTYSEIITVHRKPQAQFEITPEKAILPDDEIRFYNYSLDAVHFSWDFGDGSNSELFEPRHRYSKFGNYDVRLVVSTDYGCYDTLVVLNAFSGSEYFIDFPNAFIPNEQGPTGGYYSSKSDEAAQVFHPSFSGVSDYQLKIFSKQGILVFESRDINMGWDGYFKGQLSEPGVYVWKVRGNFRNGEPFIKMGDVTLLRN
ncbi:MAG: PKD domain-containing protein [Bacteroidetes bacterium]|nr:MAG: PKD domain-containing protein [Bacteroidota bacterium]